MANFRRKLSDYSKKQDAIKQALMQRIRKTAEASTDSVVDLHEFGVEHTVEYVSARLEKHRYE